MRHAHTPRSPERSRALWCAGAAAALLMTLACGGTFDPIPEVPEHVEYDTLCIDYEDQPCQVEEDPNGKQPLATARGALVGQQSILAAFTSATIAQTNDILRDQSDLIARIKRVPPTDTSEGTWTWENDEPGEYFKLEIATIEAPANRPRVVESYRYEITVGDSSSDNALIYQAEYYVLDAQRLRGIQQGFGVVRFFFDDARRFDSNLPTGALRIAFRSRNNVRQVRAAFQQVAESPQRDPLNALYQYVELPGNRGTLKYKGTGDFEEDGAPLETISAHAAWVSSSEGRIAARISGGSFPQGEDLLVNQCWDAMGVSVYERYNMGAPEGDLEACAQALRPLTLSAPTMLDPGTTDPEIPTAHPEE